MHLNINMATEPRFYSLCTRFFFVRFLGPSVWGEWKMKWKKKHRLHVYPKLFFSSLVFALSVYQVLFCCCCCSCIWASAENKNRGKGRKRKREREYCDEKNKTQSSPILLHMLKFFLARRDFQGNLLSKVFFFFFISELPFSVSSVPMVFRRSSFRDVACLSKQLFFRGRGYDVEIFHRRRCCCCCYCWPSSFCLSLTSAPVRSVFPSYSSSSYSCFDHYALIFNG